MPLSLQESEKPHISYLRIREGVRSVHNEIVRSSLSSLPLLPLLTPSSRIHSISFPSFPPPQPQPPPLYPPSFPHTPPSFMHFNMQTLPPPVLLLYKHRLQVLPIVCSPPPFRILHHLHCPFWFHPLSSLC